MDPRTSPDVVRYQGDYVLIDPHGGRSKVNKYTVMYIVELGLGEPDRPIMLIYRKNRKTVCTVALGSPRSAVGDGMIDFVDLVNFAIARMRKQKPLS